MTPYAKKGLFGIVLWYAFMWIGFIFDNPLLFWVSCGLCLVAVISTISFRIQGK